MTAIRVELELADGTFSTRMLHAGETVQQFTDNVTRSSPALRAMQAAGLGVITSLERADTAGRGFVSTLRDVSLVIGLVSLGISKLVGLQNSWIGNIIQTNAQMERLTFQMRGMSTAADPIADAAAAVAYLRQEAMQVPFSLQTINNGFVQLKATGIDPMAGSMQALTDGIAAVGGSNQAFDRAILAITQMAGKGVIQMQELRLQLGQDMPRAVELMARSMGVSMQQLIKDVSTGTIQAKPALEAFYAELERTYGGRATAMMQTFTGQLNRTATELQTLQLSGGKGFFEEVKKQLVDINTFLASDTAKQFADDIGHGLASAIEWVHSAVLELVSFRQEIVNVGIAVGAAFGFKIAIAGITSLRNALQTMQTELRATTFAWAEADAAAARFTITMNSGAPALVQMRAGIQGIWAGLAAMGETLLAVAPLVTALGLGIYAAGEYFGIFSNRVKDAYDNLVQFGAESRQQAAETSDAYIAQLKAQIDQVQKFSSSFASTLNFSDIVKRALGQDPYAAALTQLNAQLKDALDQRQKLIDDAAKREDEKALETLQGSVSTQMQARQSAFDQQAILTQKLYDMLDAQAATAGKSTQQLEKDRADALKQIDLDLYKDQEKILQAHIDEQRKLQVSGTDAQKKEATDALAWLSSQLKQNLSEQVTLQNQILQVPLGTKTLNDDQLFKNGQKALEKVQSDVDGLRASLQGADKDTIALQSLLEQGKYGDADNLKVRELISSLVQAQAEKSALDELMKGKQSLDNDVEQARINQLTKRMQLEEQLSGQTYTDADKIRLKIQDGYYDGLGPNSKLMNVFKGVAAGFDVTGMAANDLGTTMQTKTFGDQTVQKIDTVTDAMMKLVGAVHSLSGGLDGVHFDQISAPIAKQFQALPKVMSDNMAAAMKMLMDKGYTQTAAAGIVGNLAGESSLDPTSLHIDSNGLPSGGVANWNGQRLDDLKSFAAGLGKSWTDLQTQIDFLDKELKGSESGAYGSLTLAASPSAAADAFMRKFERPKDYSSGPARAGYAEQAYKLAPQVPDTPGYVPNEAQLALMKKADDIISDTQGKLASIDAGDKANIALENQVALVNKTKELKADIAGAADNTDGLHKNLQAVVKDINDGKFGKGFFETSADNPKYAGLLDTARKLDAVQAEINKKKTAQTAVDNQNQSLAQKQVDITNRVAEATARMVDPLDLKTTSAYRSLRTELDKYLTDVEKAYGKDSAEYKAGLDQKAKLLANFHNMEVSEAAAGYAKDAITIRNSLLSISQQRKAAYDLQIAEIDREVASFKGSEDQKVQIVAAAEADKAAIRQKYLDTVDPFMSQMRDWGDLQTELADQSKSWMDNLASGIGGLITGTNNLSETLTGIMKDMATDTVKYGFSSLASGTLGSKGGTAAALTGTTKFGGGTKSVGTAHTGAVIGSDSLVDKTFIGAGKYHTGDIIDQLRPKLDPGEVPIIAKEGEGVFTPAQMKALGGVKSASSSISIHNEVNVSGAGTPAQNDDLAKKVGDELDARMRAVFAEELLNAQRPGNILNTNGSRVR